MGNAAIAGIEHENAVSEQHQQTPTTPAQAPIEINVGSPQVQVQDLNGPLAPISPVAYTVQSGDSLSGILGTSDPAAIGAFMRANGLTSSTIYPGEQLVFPSGGYTASDATLGQAMLNHDDAVLAAEANSAFDSLGEEIDADTQPQAFNLFPNATYGMSPGEREEAFNPDATYGSTARSGPSLELLPASQTPSLGVMMKPEVANGNETDVQSGVQA